MKQKILILASLMLLLVGSMNCYGFCIYNRTDIATIDADQISGGGWFTSFWQKIDKGDKKCCGWNDHGCNTEGKRDSIVEFIISSPNKKVTIPGGKKSNRICKKSIKAYQDIIVTGSNGNYQCIAR